MPTAFDDCQCVSCLEAREEETNPNGPRVDGHGEDNGGTEPEAEESIICERCNNECDETTLVTDDDGVTFCEPCSNNSNRSCAECGYNLHDEYGDYISWYTVGNDSGRTQDVQLCESCRDNSISCCQSCDEYFWHDALSEDDYGDYYCVGCHGPERVHSYSYRPEYVFHRLPEERRDDQPYFGLEIEASARYDSRQILEWFDTELGDQQRENLIYIKEDSSIDNGYEIVTHPMTFDWAMQVFPWEALDTLVAEYGVLSKHRSTGGHVHISKEAFTSAHMWKFLQFHLRLSKFCGQMGGRGENDRWGSFLQMQTDTPLRELKSISQKKYNRNASRYFAVNLMPSYTVELRYPEGGVSSQHVKKNLMLAHAIFSFTKVLTMADVKAGALNDAGYFIAWLERRKNKYPELADYVRSMFPTPKTLPSEAN